MKYVEIDKKWYFIRDIVFVCNNLDFIYEGVKFYKIVYLF